MSTLVEFPALKEARGKLEQRRKTLRAFLDEAGPEYDMSKVKSVSGDTHAKVEHLRSLNAEIDEAAVEVEQLEVVAKAAGAAKAAEDEAGRRGRGGGIEPGADGDRPTKDSGNLGEMFVKSKAYTERRRGAEGPSTPLDMEVKALFETGAGWAPETTRTGRLVEAATRPIQVIDFIPGTTTAQAAVVYMEETVFQNNAEEVAEGEAYPEAQLELTERDSPVRKIGTWLPITDEQLEDETQAAGYVNNRLPFMIRQRLDYQILNGDGDAPNLRGVNNVTGILTQSKGADPTPDAIYKGMTLVRVEGQAIPNLVVLSPYDWQNIRLLRTADGVYIWGNPSEAGPERIWGLPVTQAQAQPAGAGLVLDTSFLELAVRRGVDVQITNSHADFFVRGRQAVRADIRAAFVVYRPAAIARISGL
ncbi:hypothetical protein GCM10027160_29030 [Streptomyces calidiresistens]|uniref:Phage major capsid protein n=1 Tax=Streptomyces calidiresistens TaxID=1485586 RepID=A0A7W3T0T7_9ACTN|nr:phage major capsid protein [Streptomyces calidiresistens]MBB0228521.1 phage major capsid protein [Streptomyces calidiresistens]